MSVPNLMLRVLLVVAVFAVPLTVLGRSEAMLNEYKDINSRMDSAFRSADAPALESVEARIRSFALSPEDSRPEWRRDKLSLLLRALDGAHSAIDPHVTADDKPSMNIAPRSTPSRVYDSGVDPSAIEDPEVRKEYEQRLEANAQKAQKTRFQSEVKLLKERWTAQLQAHVKSQYSNASADIAEIDELLSQQVSKPALRAELRTDLLKSP